MNQAMTVDETPAGTLVVGLTQDEYDAYLEREVHRDGPDRRGIRPRL
jgi:hypothetical protein